MNAVIGMTGLLLDMDLTPEQQDFVETIRTSGDSLLTIINDILDFSKIEAGKLELEYHPYRLRSCIEEALDLVSARASEKGLELAYYIEDSVPERVMGDVTRLRQILVNLLSNALKFTARGEAIVVVRAQVIGENLKGDLKALPSAAFEAQSHLGITGSPDLLQQFDHLYEIQFSVRDTGIGIPPERINRLFKAFSQVDASTTRRYGGTGLGLAISQSLSEMMGGQMWVTSQVATEQKTKGNSGLISSMAGNQPEGFFEPESQKIGSNFYFTIQVPGSFEADPEEFPENLLQSKQVLVIEGHKLNRTTLAGQIQNWGMEPTVTGTGIEGLKIIKDRPQLDLVIIGTNLPDINEVKLAQKIRFLESDLRNRQKARHPIQILMFNYVSNTNLVKQLVTSEVNCAGFINKPLKQSQFYNALMQAFSGPRILNQTNLMAARNFPGRAPRNVSGNTHSISDPVSQQAANLRILLAEDNITNQKVATKLLQRLGYRADIASNGLEVLAALKQQPYDVILMDVQMPHMDGLEVTRRICQEFGLDHQTGSRKPWIIAMTANAMRGDREMCLAAGMNDYMTKPIRRDELARALHHSHLARLGTFHQSDQLTSPRETISPGHPATSNAISPSQEHGEIEIGENGHLDPGDLKSEVEIMDQDDVVTQVPAIDAQVLQGLREYDDEDEPFVNLLIETYLHEAPNHIATLQSAVKTQNAKALKEAAHTLKSSSAQLGALQFSEFCKELEYMGQSGLEPQDQVAECFTTGSAAARLGKAEAEWQRVYQELQQELQS